MTSVVKQLQWTIDDLAGLPENGDRYEIIDGELFVTRAPHIDHQDVIGLLYAALLSWSADNKHGKPFITPGLTFSESSSVIPDFIWLSNERKKQYLDDAGHLTGPPELVVEVLSFSEKDKKRDQQTKLKLYSAQGVDEYWIVDRKRCAVAIYRRQRGVLELSMTLYESDQLTSPLLPGFSYDLRHLFMS